MLGSGSATHNLRRLMRGDPDAKPEPWAEAFDDWVADEVETGDEAGAGELSHATRRTRWTPIRPTSTSCRCMSPMARPVPARKGRAAASQLHVRQSVDGVATCFS